MSESTPIQTFGIARVVPYNLTTGIPYGSLRVLQNSSFNTTGELIENRGGASKYPWAIAEGNITAELNLAFSELPAWAYEVFAGKAATELAGEIAGSIGTLENVKGTSMTDGANGMIASITAAAEGDLKFGTYLFVADSASTMDVYYSGSDIARGTDGEYLDDQQKIATSIGAGAIAGWGLTIAEAGTFAMTIGDSASLLVNPINNGSVSVNVGGASDTYPEFGIRMYSIPTAGVVTEIDAYRCKAAGMPHNLVNNEFVSVEIAGKAFYDAVKDGVYSVRHMKI